ncbi:hypothetical protein C8J57DRAFT_1211819 [Mycena rebaudengoi]|nr:hypothetical protein C8J57DRAFT_1211819 [Mycena rebaudengoi]
MRTQRRVKYVLGGNRESLRPFMAQDATAEKKERRGGRAPGHYFIFILLWKVLKEVTEPTEDLLLTSSKPVPQNWLGWEQLTDTVVEWVVEEGQKLPLELLEQPAIGYNYVLDNDGSIYKVCSHGLGGERRYMGHQSRVRIPDDPEETRFIEGQSIEEAWTAVHQHLTALDEVESTSTVNNPTTDGDNSGEMDEDGAATRAKTTSEPIWQELWCHVYYRRQQYYARGFACHTHWQAKINRVDHRIHGLLARNDLEQELRCRAHYQRQKLVHTTGLAQNTCLQVKIDKTNERIRRLVARIGP